jgi:hypothetical protein
MPRTPIPSHDFGKTSSRISSRTARRWRIASPTAACGLSGDEPAYWRDVGTVDAFWKANIDLTDFTPELDLWDRDWPIWTYSKACRRRSSSMTRKDRRGMRGFVDGLGRLHHLGHRGAQFAAVHDGAHQFLRRRSTMRWCCPTVYVNRAMRG